MEYEDIIVALKSGNVPAEGVLDICIGRDNELNEFNNLLDKIEQGKAYTKFINGEYGSGKSFFLKVIEEIAMEKNFVVSWITLSNDIPFNKIDVIYKNIANTLKCKTGISLEHIINRWITNIKMMAFEESSNPQEQNDFIEKEINKDLKDVRIHANSIATAIENYYKFSNEGDNVNANYIQAWLRGDPNIPFTIKRKFGVKGDVNKETAFKFLEAMSVFIKSIGYSGLVVLFDEAEFIMNLHTKKLRDIAYNYIRDLYDNCSLGKFSNSLFLFAGTPEFFNDPKKGVPSYVALNNRIENVLDSEFKDLRKPIIDLKGLKREDLIELTNKLINMHEKSYNWNGNQLLDPIIPQIVDKHEINAGLTGGKVNPRTFVRSFISVLDTVQQNENEFKNIESILDLFNSKETEFEDDEDW
ncbi:MAG: ATP-binding protein [Methanobrevibacter sp.]|jgi:hypothetical protein|nr:ATP-binding protein [Methanobrevibacter sp.]